MSELNIISVSGGKDSTALYLLAKEYFGNNFLPVFADTGHEHPVTVNYVKNLHYLADGPKVNIVKADFSKRLEKKGIKPTGNAFLDLMLWKGRAPSTKAQFCTEHLKLWPILWFLQRNYPKDVFTWIMYTGIRAAESVNRAGKQPFSYNDFFDCLSVLPMLYEVEATLWHIMERNNVPPNPLYALGFERVGCFPCIHARKSELNLLPEWAWDRLAWYEKEVGSTWFPPNVLPGASGITTIEEVREWCKTSRGGVQYDLFKSQHIEDAPSCMTGFVICE